MEPSHSKLTKATESSSANFPKYLIMKHQSNDQKLTKAISPFKVDKAFKDIIGKNNFYKISPMRSGHLLVEVDRKPIAEKLLKIKNLHQTPIKVEKHRTLNITKGIIHCDQLQGMSDTDICSELTDQNVSEVYRIQKRQRDQHIPTDTFIITFQSANLPQSIKIGYLNVKVQIYIPNPRRCFNCQQYGHGKNTCQQETACAKCSKQGHTYDDCEENTEKCIHCHQEHASTSRNCPMWKLEKLILERKFRYNLSFKEARTNVYKANPALVQAVPSISTNLSPSWSNITASSGQVITTHQTDMPQNQYQKEISSLNQQLRELTRMTKHIMTYLFPSIQQTQNTQNDAHNATMDVDPTQGQKRPVDDSSLPNPKNLKGESHPSSGKGPNTPAALSSNEVENSSAALENSNAVQKGSVDEEGFKIPLRHSRPRDRDGGSSPQRSRSRSSMRRNKYGPLSDEDSESTDRPGNGPPDRPPRNKKAQRDRLGSHSSSDSDKSSTTNKPKYIPITSPK